MTAPPLLDPPSAVATVLAWLREHNDVLTEFGGDPDRIGGTFEEPFPRVQVLHAESNDLDLRWQTRAGLLIRTYGTLDGRPGSHELRRMHYVVLSAVHNIPATRPVPFGRGVITRVTGGGSRPRQEPLTAQPYWESSRSCDIHPTRDD